MPPEITPQESEKRLAALEDVGAASGEVEALGYKQELKRSLSLFDLLGLRPGVHRPDRAVALVRLRVQRQRRHGAAGLRDRPGGDGVHGALSYMAMSAAFPVAGSVYAYAGRGIGESAGFLAGWAHAARLSAAADARSTSSAPSRCTRSTRQFPRLLLVDRLPRLQHRDQPVRHREHRAAQRRCCWCRN